MLKIYHAPRARSVRVIWLCEEMGVPYETQTESFMSPSPDFLDANPLRSFPAMRDGEVCMIESVAMMMYIMGKYGPTDLEVKPSDPRYADSLQFLMFGEAGMAMYGNPLVATKFMCPEDKRDNWTAGYLKKALGKRLEFVEQRMGANDYILGDRFTAADISVGYSVGMSGFAADVELSPKLAAYQQRLAARPAFQRASAVQ